MRKQLTITVLVFAQILFATVPFLSEAASAQSTKTGTLSGSVWLDTNNNGIYELDESPQPNVTVEIKTKDGALVQEAQTDENGHYLFTELEYGEYIVWATNLSGISVRMGIIQIAEVNGIISLDIPLSPASSDDSSMLPGVSSSKSIFLALING